MVEDEAVLSPRGRSLRDDGRVGDEADESAGGALGRVDDHGLGRAGGGRGGDFDGGDGVAVGQRSVPTRLRGGSVTSSEAVPGWLGGPR